MKSISQFRRLQYSSVLRLVLGLLAISLLASVLLTSCREHSKESITIGISLPLSGPAASYGEAAQKGIQIAYDDFLASHPDLKGGVLLDIQDDKANPKDGITVYQKFKSSGTRIYLGPMVSGVALAVTDLAKSDDFLFILPTATNPRLRGRSPLIYRTCVSDDAEGSAVAEFTYKRDSNQTLAVVHINNEYGLGVATVFSDAYRKLGGKISLIEAYEAESSNLRDLATKVRQSNASALFIVGQKEQTQVIKHLREAGFTGQIYGTTMFEDPQLIESPGADGAIFSTRVLADGTNGQQPHALFREYKERFGGEANYYTASFHDGTAVALLTAAELLKNAKADLKSLPRTVGLKRGATGPLDFDEKNDVIQPFAFKQIRGGKAELIP
jgi:branched-chain amino acid transport system substrate-binding protein